MAYSDDEIMNLIKSEMQRALGFDGDYSNSTDLQEKRERALKYYKGEMDDISHVEGRSAVVSTDVHDVIQQAVPDIVEIFLDEDIATFNATSEADTAAAEQETDFVKFVVMEQNNGFRLFQTSMKDALLLGVGYLMWQWEDAPEPDVDTFKGVTEMEVMNAMATNDPETNPDAGLVEVTAVNESEDGDPSKTTYDFTITQRRAEGKCVITAWSPDDVCVSDDTLKLGEGTFCAFRARVRRQDLLADGYDPDTVDMLPAYAPFANEIEMARDFGGESSNFLGGASSSNMDTVEVVYNFIRVVEPPKYKSVLYRVVTGGANADSVILKKEEVDCVPACAITPYPVSHRFFGESMAETVFEIQRVKTSLMRSGLDNIYFAMNQRMVVAQSGVTKHTLTDILNNTPGSPIRVKSLEAVQPVTAGSLNVDPFSTVEFVNNWKEETSGVSRQAMGIAPDTMHETKGGMLAMMTASQRRIRFIARNFAETGIKDLFMGVHKTLRKNATIAQTIRLRNQWVEVNPASWAERYDMTVEIGNAGGRDYDVAQYQALMNVQQEAVKAQGGPDGPLTTPKYLLNTATKMTARMGLKNPEQYWPDPRQFEMQQAQAAQQPQVDPEVQKVQAELQLKQQTAQMQMQVEMQIAQAKLAHESQMAQMKFEHERAMDIMKLQMENEKTMLQAQNKNTQLQAEVALKEREQNLETLLAREEMFVKDAHEKQRDAHNYRVSQSSEVDTNISGPHLGGDTAK